MSELEENSLPNPNETTLRERTRLLEEKLGDLQRALSRLSALLVDHKHDQVDGSVVVPLAKL